MAVRTDPDAVKAVLAMGRDYDTKNNPSITPAIDLATVLVDKVAACATRKSKTIDATTLELLERWIAAHVFKMGDRQYSSKKTGDAAGAYVGLHGMRLEMTSYGQTALSLDDTGCLAAISQGDKRASAAWLGKPPSEQIDYRDRD